MERFEEAWKTADAASVNCLVPTITKTSEKYKSLSDDEWIEAMKAICFLLKSTRWDLDQRYLKYQRPSYSEWIIIPRL